VKRLRGYVTVLLLSATLVVIEQLRTQEVTRRGVVVAGAFGTFLKDNNDFALAILFFLPFAIYLLLSSKRLSVKLATGALSLTFLWSIVVTGSRGGAIGLLAVLFVLWLKTKHKIAVGLGILLLLFTIWSFSSPAYKKRITSISRYQKEESATVRREAWKAGYRMFLRQPLFGVGATNFPAGYALEGFGMETGGIWKTAHSLYIQTLAELGLAGIAWLLAMIFFIMRTAIRAGRTPRDDPALTFPVAMGHAVQVSLVGYLVAGAFLSCLYYPYFLLLSGLAIAAERNAEEVKAVVEASPVEMESSSLPPQISDGS
jgi:probable O-glycosylation ligase (exosortase A-associated)